jgi:hypothetical protein
LLLRTRHYGRAMLLKKKHHGQRNEAAHRMYLSPTVC